MILFFDSMLGAHVHTLNMEYYQEIFSAPYFFQGH